MIIEYVAGAFCFLLPQILLIALITYKFRLNKPLICYGVACISYIVINLLSGGLSLESLFSIPFGTLILGSIYWGGVSLITNIVIKHKGTVQISETSKDYVFCPKCGLEQWKGYANCQKCGFELRKGTTS
jgi:hypothetical protein